MLIVDSIEKVARIFLWLAIASACVIAPISYIRAHAADDETKKAELLASAKTAEAELAKKSEKIRRLGLASMGTFMTSLSTSQAQGNLWFTNVSPRVGILCVYGVAKNRKTQQSASSLPACKEVDAYASDVHVQVMFAGSDVSDACAASSCELTFEEATERKQ